MEVVIICSCQYDKMLIGRTDLLYSEFPKSAFGSPVVYAALDTTPFHAAERLISKNISSPLRKRLTLIN